MLKARGFGLLELLVAVAIVGVLAAVLIPALQRARERAETAGCQANLQRIGHGLSQLTTDSASILPNSAYGSTTAPSNNSDSYKWMDAIETYVGSERTFLCPSDRGAKYRAALKLPNGETSTDYGSYGMNGAYRDAGDGQTPPRSTAAAPVRASLLAAPSRTVWVADTNNREEANGSFGFTWANAAANPSITTSSPRQLEKIIERHQRSANAVFCDGHVEALPLEAFAATKQIIDPVTGESKSVMTLFTIEAD